MPTSERNLTTGLAAINGRDISEAFPAHSALRNSQLVHTLDGCGHIRDTTTDGSELVCGRLHFPAAPIQPEAWSYSEIRGAAALPRLGCETCATHLQAFCILAISEKDDLRVARAHARSVADSLDILQEVASA
jgi:hypothetical protein